MTIFLNVTYNGKNYHGFQRQPNRATIQQQLENALSIIYKAPITIKGTSRTDAGVHALSQGVCFCVFRSQIPLERLPMVVNNNLPPDIVVTEAKEVEDGYNPRHRAVRKTYVYTIHISEYRSPFLADTAWNIKEALNVTEMEKAAQGFVGTFDFSSFCASGGEKEDNTRTIYSLDVKAENNLVNVIVTGDGFLYNMVRIIVGTLYFVGIGKIPSNNIHSIIMSKKREKAGPTAPPQGLMLYEVVYK